jgi:hypothetical protein
MLNTTFRIANRKIWEERGQKGARRKYLGSDQGGVSSVK